MIEWVSEFSGSWFSVVVAFLCRAVSVQFEGLGFWVQGAGFRVQGLGFWVQGAGFEG